MGKAEFLSEIDEGFPREGLGAALRALELALELSITLHDRSGLLSDDEGRTFFSGVHQHPYCKLGRVPKAEWDARCVRDCADEVEALASRRSTPFVHHCWKGVSELVVPVHVNGRVAMTLFAGVFKSEGDELDPSLERRLGAEREGLKFLSPEEIEVKKSALLLASRGILRYALGRVRGEGGAASRKDLIARYLFEKAAANASLEELAERLCLSVSRTRRLVVEHFGVPFHELFLNERLRRARNMLLSGDLSLQEIASSVGISNVYYFNRRFSLRYGIPPGACRKAAKAAKAGDEGI